jgi:hypothetical protein
VKRIRITPYLVWVITILVLTVIMIFQVHSIEGERWLRYVGDDLFYYFSIVEVFSTEWILSASKEPSAWTNGFHVLWFLNILTISKIFRQDVWSTISIIVSLNLLLWTGTMVLLQRIIASYNFKVTSYIVTTAIFVSPTMKLVCYGGLEGPLFTFLFVAAILRLGNQLRKLKDLGELSRRDIRNNFFLLVILVLARTEGFILATLFVLSVSLNQRTFRNRTLFYWVAFCSLWFLGNRLIFGGFSQSSTLFYSTYFRPRNTGSDLLQNFENFFNFSPDITLWSFNLKSVDSSLILFVSLIFLFLINRLNFGGLSKISQIALVNAVLAVTISATYYSFVQGTPAFARYKMTGVVVFGLLVSLIIGSCETLIIKLLKYPKTPSKVFLEKGFFGKLNSLHWKTFTMVLFAGMMISSSTVEATSLISQVGKQDPDERAMFVQAGERIKKGIESNRIDGSVAGLNSGIMGYFSGQQVLNIDGRVNSEIFNFGKNGKSITSIPELHRYLKSKNIKYLVDAFEVPIRHMTQDYNASDLCVSLVFIYQYKISELSPWYGGIGLFRVAEEIPEACLVG